MLSDFFFNVKEGYLAPRRSARRMIGRNLDLRTSFLMVLLAYAIQSALTLATMIIVPAASLPQPERLSEAERFGFGFLLAGLFYIVASTLVYALGRKSGGKGQRDEVFAVMAWHALVTSFLAPLQIIFIGAEDPGTGQIGGLALLGGLGSVAVTLWLMANYIAEVHRFKNVGKVALVIIGVGMATLMVFGSILINILGGAAKI